MDQSLQQTYGGASVATAAEPGVITLDERVPAAQLSVGRYWRLPRFYAVGLRLEIIERAMCPRFHVDHVGIRMLCTYRGPGTEWLDDEAADRNFLGARGSGLRSEADFRRLGMDDSLRRLAPMVAALKDVPEIWEIATDPNAPPSMMMESPLWKLDASLAR